ncbi:2OG-Fe(II) oxygenase family protein [Hwanghaeella grinnelliae]|nr:2OG-Fe(II) oxygenase [Hwanghaeella grinnelliae]
MRPLYIIPIPPTPPIPGRLPEAFVSRQGLFSDEEMDRIQQAALHRESRRVVVGLDNKVDPDGNLSFVRHLPPNKEMQWAYQRILDVISELNARHFQFDITGIDEPLYHVTYEGNEKGHYNWHIDANAPDRPRRKLAITFQMSHPNEYEGGDLEINMTGIPVTAPKERGTLVMFPANHIHRVTPVTKGTRCALVTWIVGPPFK